MQFGLASLTLAFALGPSVAVEIASDESSRRGRDQTLTVLRGWLVQRLIEEGVTIAPAGQAGQVITLRPDAGAIALESAGQHFVVDAGPAAVMRLEALHRTRWMIAHAEQTPDEQTPSERALAEQTLTGAASAAVLGFRSVTEAPEGAAGALESALLVEGYVLTPNPRSEDPVLCVKHSATQLGASVTLGAAACPDPTVWLRYAAIGEPGGVRPIVELLASPPKSQPTISGSEAAAEMLEAKESLAGEPAATARRGWSSEDAEFRLMVDGGVAVRGAADPFVRVASRLGLGPGPGGVLQVSVTPSRGGQFRAVDTVLAAGPDLRFGRKRFGFDFALVAGALIHAYQNETGRGGAASWYFGLPAALSFGKHSGPRARLFAEGFATGVRLQHVRTNASDWVRTAWGVRVGLGFTFGWDIQ